MYGEYSAHTSDAGWSSLVARRAHNPKVVGSNPAPATNLDNNIKTHFSVPFSIRDRLKPAPPATNTAIIYSPMQRR